MPANPRVRTNNVQGTITDNPLTNVATTINSAGLANLAAIATQHAILVLDPLRAAGAPEIVVVTAHTGSATSATITRGAYGTSARQHNLGTLWVHAPLTEDFVAITTSGARPSDPYRGQLIFETDTDQLVARSVADAWQTVVDLGAWDTYTPTNTNITLGNGVQVARWTRIGRTVHVVYALTFGSTTAFGGTVTVGLPVTALDLSQSLSLGLVHMLDAGTTNRIGMAMLVTGTATGVNFIPDSSGGFVDATTPHTWAVNDRLAFSLTYQAAA